MYVTDVIGESYKTWQTGVVLINAGTGTGKTMMTNWRAGWIASQKAKRHWCL